MKLFNTLTGKKEEFTPSGDIVKMYVCGITPYAEAHVGHAMSYIIFDMLRRYLEYKGYTVRHIQNFTDIDDKIIARAQTLGIPAASLAEGYIQEYEEDMRGLNIKPATVYPRATQEVPKIQEIIEGLIQRGYAYQADGDVYFRVQRKADYGKLSGRNLESLMAGARVEPGEGKEYPLDFALWKAAKPGEPSWPSPWGSGRPGWHIECSAMSLEYLGETIDIHGGGQDLIFPHHENEIAQSEAFTGKEPFARFWVHNGLLHLGEEKMSKSLGNLVSVRDAVARYGADGLRIFVLSSHYRSPLTYLEEGIVAGQRGAERLRLAVNRPSPEGGKGALDAEVYRRRFLEAMDDDLNTPQALAALFDLARQINRAADEGMAIADAQATLKELAGVLGLTLAEPQRDMRAGQLVDLLVAIRSELRAIRQYALADRIRARLGEIGIALEDTPQGTRWRYRGSEVAKGREGQ